MPRHHEPPFSFDHLIHVVDDLEGAMASYDAVGLPTHTALTMPGFRIAAWGVDDERYVELAVVEDWDAAATSTYADSLSTLRPAIEASPTGLVTFAVHVPDAHETARSLRDAGHAVHVSDVTFEDHPVQDAGFTEVFVADVPTWFPFFITYRPPRPVIAQMRADHRTSTGGDAEPACTNGPDLVSLLVRSDSPTDEARQLAGILSCPVDETSDKLTITLPGAEINVEATTPDGPPAGLYGFTVRRAGGSTVPVDVSGATVVSA